MCSGCCPVSGVDDVAFAIVVGCGRGAEDLLSDLGAPPWPRSDVNGRRWILDKRANSGQSSDTKFRLFTRLNPHVAIFLVSAEKDTVLNSTYNAQWETKIYIHGYLNSGKLLAPEMLKDRFLIRGDYNIIMVDWGRKSQDLYGRVVNQVVPEVGQQLATLIRVIQNATGANWKSFHLIGCSIGAHVAGFAGKYLKSQIGRITGLDPASPRYKNLASQKRLSRTDAEFVDVIHTDVSGMVPFGGFGLREPIGHLDFFPNGGDKQPNCSRADVLCEHLRSYDYYMETITRDPSCVMVGFVCSDWSTFLQGRCTDCGPRNDLCFKFGEPAAVYKAFKDDSKSLVVYMKTGGYYPYCVYHYEVRLEVIADVAGRYSMQNSSLTLTLGTKIQLHIALTQIAPSFKSLVHSYTNLVTSLEPLDGLSEVTVSKKADFANLESLVNFVHMKPMNQASQREQIRNSKLFCPIGNTLVRKRLSILKLSACTSS
ncbi:lipase, putative [Ixodes scapularis]|uniref:Lipase, putative n=1 Tax=Ixodes scapularis TaxID=6945 RepID=B7Q3Y8_IXOSC|nr:lipase, putative [Ixodes scapularis]|eukprot:XP_002399776.1 lipase, putative [Ixodes scapularis]